jgi:hypothetical protein
MKRKDINKKILDDWNVPVHMVFIIDGKAYNAVRCVFYIGGKGYESYYSLFAPDGEHVGFVKYSDVRPYMSFSEIIV